QTRFSSHLLELRPSEHGLADHGKLRIDIALDGKALEERAQRRTRVDKDARAGLVHVWQGEHNRPADRTHAPGDRQRDPAKAPSATQLIQDLFDDRSHADGSVLEERFGYDQNIP